MYTTIRFIGLWGGVWGGRVGDWRSRSIEMIAQSKGKRVAKVKKEAGNSEWEETRNPNASSGTRSECTTAA
jgi:hypothetical protein